MNGQSMLARVIQRVGQVMDEQQDYDWWGVCRGCGRELSNEGEEHEPDCPVLAREQADG